ncbi:MAG: hypothetical protein CVV64_07465 [Candidatus Wallbacteria bacterium HGW-Wallbacteria-1]|jgi:hypothetical protein|uniref:Porin domain-containing protein n=1 Tax=Candidatus Wallbacteria bacterium HGW-Wallbacteria-1 TaxID=2013854 RepID=A0A2N1PQU8_9BACT|nr:MAG: hypothetical protein CVV64_07465 [Candidatus Wallbacteria bacterium HGW-Wallbacteria-1]
MIQFFKGAITGAMALILILSIAMPANSQDWGEKIHVHGFISQGYIDSDANNFLGNSKDGTFDFTEIGLNFQTMSGDRTKLGMQILQRNLGEYSSFAIDWANAEYKISDKFSFKAGKIKLPFGLHNQRRDLDLVRTQILLPTGVYNETMRGILNAATGVGLNGYVDSRYRLDYEVVMGSVDVDSDDDFLKSLFPLVFPTATNAGLDIDKIWEAKFTWHSPIEGLRLAYNPGQADITLSGTQSGTNFAFDADVDSKILSLLYTRDNFTLTSERMDMRFLMPTPTKTVKIEPYSWYVGATYRRTDFFEFGLYRSEYFTNKSDKQGNMFKLVGAQDFRAWLKDTCLSLRFDITDNYIVKAEYHRMNGVANLIGIYNPQGYIQNWDLFVLKTTFSF